jgi:hypothetical protein
MKGFEMARPNGVISVRDRFGTLLRQSRPYMVMELLLAIVCVALKLIGAIHNPTLLILLIGWLSLWLRRSGWRQIGLGQPRLVHGAVPLLWSKPVVANHCPRCRGHNELDTSLPGLHSPLTIPAKDEPGDQRGVDIRFVGVSLRPCHFRFFKDSLGSLGPA